MSERPISREYVEGIEAGHWTLPFGNASAIELARALLAQDDALNRIGCCVDPNVEDWQRPSLKDIAAYARAAMLPTSE